MKRSRQRTQAATARLRKLSLGFWASDPRSRANRAEKFRTTEAVISQRTCAQG